MTGGRLCGCGVITRRSFSVPSSLFGGTLVATVPRLCSPTRQSAARKKKSGRFARDDRERPLGLLRRAGLTANASRAKRAGQAQPLQRRWRRQNCGAEGRMFIGHFAVGFAEKRERTPRAQAGVPVPPKRETARLAGVDDDPVGDGVPEGGFAEGKADLLDEDQGRSGPEGGAVNLAGGP